MIDYSAQYAKDHKAYIYFSDGSTTVKFKAFLSSLSINMDVERAEVENKKNDLMQYNDIGVHYTYSFSLDIPFYNYDEAVKGKGDIDTLEQVLRPDSRTRAKEYFSKGIKILLSNLINNGSGTTDVGAHGLSAVIKSFNIEYNSEMGWFDSKRKFYSKHYTISFELNALIYKNKKKDLCRGFNKEGEYDKEDVKYWPFNETNAASYGSHNSYENSYISSHDAKIKIAHYSGARSVIFSAFLENISKTNSWEFGELKVGATIYTPKEIKQTAYKFTIHVPANNIEQARSNMAQAQTLLRILAPQKVTRGRTQAATISFSNLIEKQGAYINSVSIKIDTDLGFFEKDGRFYIKNYTLDLNAEKAVKTAAKASKGRKRTPAAKKGSPRRRSAAKKKK